MADRFPEPVEAKKFLSKKVNVETDAWDELKWGEHAHAFTVAHSMQAGVLDAVHGLLNKALAEGQSFQDFRNGMLDAMDKLGWYGRADKTKDDTAYINWRIKVIYNTNMRTAYAAGQYRDNLENAEARPIWVYKSKLVGKNRRQEHIALHDKAFRYDDPFWNTYYPPNCWECKCRVTTKSEHGAKRDGITVSASDKNGNPPALSGVDWNSFDPTWQYNPAREALAPNFNKYAMLNRDAELRHQVMKRYNQSMNGTVLTKEEWKVVAHRANETDYKPAGVMYQIGNLNYADYTAVYDKTGVFDSKVMATDHDLWHSMGHKQKRIQDAKAAKKTQSEIQRLIDQAVDIKDFDAVYKTYSEPEHIFKETVANKKETYTLLHFTKDMGKGKTLRIVFRARYMPEGKLYTAIQLLSMEIVESMEYNKGGRYEKIK
jgi:hypothetical protein